MQRGFYGIVIFVRERENDLSPPRAPTSEYNTNYSWTFEIREEHVLVENGLFRYVRHPIYLGTFIGVVAVLFYASSFLGVLFGLLAIHCLFTG